MPLSQPVWIVALALAACAPWCVRVVADRFELRVRARTAALVARALARTSTSDAPGGSAGAQAERGRGEAKPVA